MCTTPKSLRVIKIVDGTTVDGPGFRTSIYFAGCTHHCHGCHNPSTWAPNAGHDMTITELLSIIKENDFDVTFSGGDPMFQVEQLTPLAKEIKKIGKTVWLYTGYTFEAVISNPKLIQILPYIDVMVDGPFIESERDTTLLFKGSTNQRLIDVQYWLKTGATKIWESDF